MQRSGSCRCAFCVGDPHPRRAACPRRASAPARPSASNPAGNSSCPRAHRTCSRGPRPGRRPLPACLRSGHPPESPARTSAAVAPPHPLPPARPGPSGSGAGRCRWRRPGAAALCSGRAGARSPGPCPASPQPLPAVCRSAGQASTPDGLGAGGRWRRACRLTTCTPQYGGGPGWPARASPTLPACLLRRAWPGPAAAAAALDGACTRRPPRLLQPRPASAGILLVGDRPEPKWPDELAGDREFLVGCRQLRHRHGWGGVSVQARDPGPARYPSRPEIRIGTALD